MRIEDIVNIKTLENIEKYNINIEEFDDINTLRTYITKLRTKNYRDNKKDYFRVYMRERYRKNHIKV
jgi:selenocysteine-specific translation elongation factor